MNDQVLVIVGLSLGLLSIYFGALALQKYSARKRIPKMRYGEILPADEMKEKHGLTIENYTPPTLNPENVPADLRDLLPIARKWGIGDDIIREDMQQKATNDEKTNLINQLEGRTKRINEWLDSFENSQFTPEAAAFLYLLLGHEEIIVLNKL
jgi:hypothetical protein